MSRTLDTPDGWTQLSSTDRSSTISYFVTGAECVAETGEAAVGDEVLVWQGVENEDEVYHLESHLGHDVPDNAQFLIEVHENDTLVKERFASTERDALAKATDELQRLAGND